MEQYDANDLLIFARIVDAGSLTRASEWIGLPKSTLSRRLSMLEDRLGERLLHRTTRRFALTELGAALLVHARQLAAEVEAVSLLAQNRKQLPSGRLCVSMPSDFAMLLLADTLAAFSALHPEITLELDLTPRRVDLLGEGVDLALRVGEVTDTPSLSARRLALLRYSLYASPAYLAEHGQPSTPDDLAAHQGLLLRTAPTGSPSVWKLQNGNKYWEGTPAGRIQANSPELLLRFACAGAGIVSAPVCFAAPYLLKDELVAVLPQWQPPAYPVWALFPERRLMPGKTRAFLNMLESALAELV